MQCKFGLWDIAASAMELDDAAQPVWFDPHRAMPAYPTLHLPQAMSACLSLSTFPTCQQQQCDTIHLNRKTLENTFTSCNPPFENIPMHAAANANLETHRELTALPACSTPTAAPHMIGPAAWLPSLAYTLVQHITKHSI